MKKFFQFLDPYHQGPWFFKWDFWGLTFMVGGSFYMCTHTKGFGDVLMDNIFIYFPNYLTHEILGHNIVGEVGWRICHESCPALGDWWASAMGNGMETLLPLGLLLIALRMSGGRWLLPGLWYWLGSTLYEAGVYASDARACKLPLTSSDMMTNYAPGTVKGDWHYILEPLGLLNYDTIIGQILIIFGVVCVVLAIYSLYYYCTHVDQYWGGSQNSY